VLLHHFIITMFIIIIIRAFELEW